jgi:2-phospho-L-lactate guanylyltransferase
VTIAVLPAKPLQHAKTRLATVLEPGARAAIARAMFDDVLAALTGADRIARVLVVTADDALADRARAAGAFVVPEHEPRGLNAAVALGTGAAVALGAHAVMVVLSDIPLIRTADVEQLLARTPRHGALIVPSKEGIGTNAIVRRPPAIFGPCFGGRSLARHLAAAERTGVRCVVARNPRVEFDVDTPDDLRMVAAGESATATYREATRLRVAPSAPVI